MRCFVHAMKRPQWIIVVEFSLYCWHCRLFLAVLFLHTYMACVCAPLCVISNAITLCTIMCIFRITNIVWREKNCMIESHRFFSYFFFSHSFWCWIQSTKKLSFNLSYDCTFLLNSKFIRAALFVLPILFSVCVLCVYESKHIDRDEETTECTVHMHILANDFSKKKYEKNSCKRLKHIQCIRVRLCLCSRFNTYTYRYKLRGSLHRNSQNKKKER